MNDNDQIYKLIKLANDNPNEEEANHAARKVCLLLKDKKFEFVEMRFDPSKWCMRHHTYKTACGCG